MINPGVGPKKSQFILDDEDLLNEDIFKEYIAQNGIDRAAGFIEAAKHITQHLKTILGNLETSGAPVFSVYNIKTNSHLLYKYLDNFITRHSNDGTPDHGVFPSPP